MNQQPGEPKVSRRRLPRLPRLPFGPGLAAILTICAASGPAEAQTAAAAGPAAADYTAAANLLRGNVTGLVRNESVQPHWIGNSGRFWYRRDGASGPEFVLVGENGARSPAFDHTGISRALTQALARPDGSGDALALLTDVALDDGLAHLLARVGDRSVNCDLRALRCSTDPAPTVDPALLNSPDGRQAVLVRDGNLFLRNLATGDERQLTTDGAPHYSWATLPESSLTTVTRRRTGIATPPFETYWSPDGRYLITSRTDERNVGVMPFVEWVPIDGSRRPIVHEVRTQLTGDREELKLDYFLFDLETGRRSRIELPEGHVMGSLDGLVLDWSRSRGQAFLLTRARGARSAAVFRLNLADSALVKIFEESSDTRFQPNSMEYNRANVRILGDGAELVWFSDRTGWGHLYLYDAQTGRLKNAITRGDWLVHDIQVVDEARREIYFTAGGREPGRDPYYRHLYRGRLDGRGDVRLLTEPNADHHFDPAPTAVMVRLFGRSLPPSKINPVAGVFVDTWSTVDTAPVTVLRSARDGQIIAELERADATALFATGWRAPTRERVEAADGRTDLYSVYYAPYGAQPGRTYPVIDAAYGGPQIFVAPRNFVEAYMGGAAGGANALARLGFAVVTVDGRGTPGRSRAFRDAGYTEFTQVGIDDHIAAISELARRHPEIDLRRVGVQGWSWGGAFSAQAILSRPEFYSVAVSGAGTYDYAAIYPGFDYYIGPPAYADGTRFRGSPTEAPANWERLDITRLARNLTGHLMIVYGDLDENVPPNQAFRLVDALTRANRPYDLLYLPNRTHSGGGDAYTVKRTWDYFIEHLMGADPVLDVTIQTRRPPR
jgi:dipeptidyl aminopeptidase/acylaminoacyl peptidase